jgi:hypothetical protein
VIAEGNSLNKEGMIEKLTCNAFQKQEDTLKSFLHATNGWW